MQDVMRGQLPRAIVAHAAWPANLRSARGASDPRAPQLGHVLPDLRRFLLHLLDLALESLEARQVFFDSAERPHHIWCRGLNRFCLFCIHSFVLFLFCNRRRQSADFVWFCSKENLSLLKNRFPVAVSRRILEGFLINTLLQRGAGSCENARNRFNGFSGSDSKRQR